MSLNAVKKTLIVTLFASTLSGCATPEEFFEETRKFISINIIGEKNETESHVSSSNQAPKTTVRFTESEYTGSTDKGVLLLEARLRPSSYEEEDEAVVVAAIDTMLYRVNERVTTNKGASGVALARADQIFGNKKPVKPGNKLGNKTTNSGSGGIVIAMERPGDSQNTGIILASNQGVQKVAQGDDFFSSNIRSTAVYIPDEDDFFSKSPSM